MPFLSLRFIFSPYESSWFQNLAIFILHVNSIQKGYFGLLTEILDGVNESDENGKILKRR
ncbi:hypothetical protein Hdeb2414_s0015g00446741 [Helianthus debilis subsp. tardiflorus]